VGQSVGRPDGAALLVNDYPDVGLLAFDKRVSIGLKAVLEAVHAGGDAPQGGDRGLGLGEIEARSLGALTCARRHGRAGPLRIISKRLHQPSSYFCQAPLIEYLEHRAVVPSQGRRLAERMFTDAGDALGPDFRAAIQQGAAAGVYVGEHNVCMSAASSMGHGSFFSVTNHHVSALAVWIEFAPSPVGTSKQLLLRAVPVGVDRQVMERGTCP
jgi:hypothetical protein